MLPFALVNQHVLPRLGPFVMSLASKATIQVKWHSALSKVPWASLLAVGLHQCSRREARSSSLYGRRTTPLDLVLLGWPILSGKQYRSGKLNETDFGLCNIAAPWLCDRPLACLYWLRRRKSVGELNPGNVLAGPISVISIYSSYNQLKGQKLSPNLCSDKA